MLHRGDESHSSLVRTMKRRCLTMVEQWRAIVQQLEVELDALEKHLPEDCQVGHACYTEFLHTQNHVVSDSKRFA